MINLFFLFNGFLQTTEVSTNSPLASLVPVGWVIAMGMAFELVAEIRRRRYANKVNRVKVKRVYRGDSLQESETTSRNLKVGDVIKIDNDCVIPADCLVLSTGDELG